MFKKKQRQHKDRFADVDRLNTRIQEETPKSGDYLYDYKLQQAKTEINTLDEPQFHRKYKINFADLPVSAVTASGLSQRNFNKMTEIQRCVIPHALGGRDIMAASRTGSGKTLAYLVPLVENLYRNKFISVDGLGAIVLVPVRELAMQVFEVLNSFTKKMEINVGLIIGGKDIKYQKDRIHNMNILICTPGRLLQHLEETYGFQTHNLKLLIIDEADQMLEMGFKQTLEEILKSLPPRQTMLFSATLNKNIQALAMLSLNNPQRIFLHSVKTEKEAEDKAYISSIYETPIKLAQYYMEVAPQNKINTLYSFIKEHPKKKILVFLSTCKQVRFVYQAFKTFKFGCPIYELQGRQKQTKRMAIYYTFCEKQYGILFCTNIASRGLDFPQIDWVVQVDIPEDVETYVHRVGRTARFRAEGRSLAFVTPSEIKFAEKLKQKKLVIHKISQNPTKLYPIQSSLQSRCSESQDLKYLAQRALVSYLKFVFKAPDKEVFDVHKIDGAALAESYGLVNAPVITFKKKTEQAIIASESSQIEGDSNEQEEPITNKKQNTVQKTQAQPQKKMTKIEKLRAKVKAKKQEKRNHSNLLASRSGVAGTPVDESEEQAEEQLFTLKRTVLPDSNQKPVLPKLSKNQLKKIKPYGHYEGKNKIMFEEDGKPITEAEASRKAFESNVDKNFNMLGQIVQRIEKNRDVDKEDQQKRRRERRLKKKIKEREAREEILGGGKAVLDASGDEEQDMELEDDE